jgi:hypothetical protein
MEVSKTINRLLPQASIDMAFVRYFMIAPRKQNIQAYYYAPKTSEVIEASAILLFCFTQSQIMSASCTSTLLTP